MAQRGSTYIFSCLTRELALALAVLLFLATASSVVAADKTDQRNEPVQLAKYLSLGVKTERLVNSHTSYEFGDPDPPYPAHLSKLVFPMDSWWGGLELRFNTPRFSVGAEFLTNVVEDTHKPMKDYDWAYETTDGHAWHASAGLKKSLLRNLFLGVHADYMKIRTTGTHRRTQYG